MSESSGPKQGQIGPYRIVSRLGSGGMGEVYRARDTRLGRDVAIKVLLETVAADPERMARFEREARVAASLNHPNIAAIYGFEEVGDSHFLVMELVEGRSLADRLSAGPLPIDEALGIVEQIAGGLEAAHDSGVVHRDLKPSNVMLTPDGKAKILDFGVAKALSEEPAAHSLEHSPTLSANFTAPGMMIGTVPYMSPEQARGRPVDRRTDIWALGCVLYECLTGRRAFDGETATDVLAKILERDPSWEALLPRTPARIRELVQKCLEKDVRRRIRDAGDVRIELERAREAREWTSSGAVPAAIPARRIPVALAWGIAAVAVATAVIATIAANGHSSSKLGPEQMRPGIPLRVDVTDPDIPRWASTDLASVAISPDGKTIAYLANERNGIDARICLRPVDEIHAIRQVRSPEVAYVLTGPFFSPDSKWLGFASTGLYKLPLSGGEPTLVVESRSLGGMKGAAWTSRGIVFSPAAKAGLWLVDENGGSPQTLTVPNASQGEVSHRWPSALPDGRHVLFTIKKEGIASFDQGEIALLDLETKSWKTLLKGGSFAIYVPTGHIVYARAGGILAVPFDLRAEKVTGPPVTVVTNVMTEPGSGAAQFAVAQDAGALLYAPGGPNIQRRELVWFDRRGNIVPIGAPLQPYYDPKLSPDGSRIAATVFGATDTVIVYDVARGSSLRANTDGNCTLVSWHPDGRGLLISSDAQGGGARHLYLTGDDGTVAPRPVLPDLDGDTARAVVKTADGVGVVHNDENGLYLSRIEGGGERRRVTSSGEVAPARPAVSPDGRWLAYDVDVSGGRDVYVRPFPTGNGTWQISHGGGIAPRWSPRGDELLYLREAPAAETLLMSVRLTATPAGLSVAAPKELVKIPHGVEVLSFHPDGERILAVREVAPQYKGDRVVAVLNWFDQLRAKAPTR